MAVSRLKASELLNMSEMRLFDDSRPGELRTMTRAALAARVTRARAARDRARDLLKRQKQAARARGDTAGGKSDVAIRTGRKEALLVDILQRFVEARRDAPATGTTGAAASTAKAAPREAKTAKATRSSKATGAAKVTKATRATGAAKVTKATRATGAAKVTKASTATRTAKPAKTSKTSDKPAVERPSASRKATKKAASASKPDARPSRRLTPGKALANTRELLAAKQQRDREAQPWQSLDPTASHVPDAGYQSPEAKAKAADLHAAESRMASNHGSMGARDRHAQGRRDHRGDTD